MRGSEVYTTDPNFYDVMQHYIQLDNIFSPASKA